MALIESELKLRGLICCRDQTLNYFLLFQLISLNMKLEDFQGFSSLKR